MRSLAIALLCLSSIALTVWASPDATQIGQATNAPGEGNCGDCHGHVNDGPGSASFYGVGGAYNLGQLFEMGVSVEQISQGRWGFMITALDGANQPAGTFSLTDAARTMQLSNSGRSYVAHTANGTDAGVTHQTSWAFRWTAPETDVGPVTLYLSAMASNNDNGTGGDYTYTTTYTLGYSSVFDAPQSPLPGGYATLRNHPNPFNAGTVITFDLARPVHGRLDIYDILGRRVATLLNEPLEAGHHEIAWNGDVESRGEAPSGIYFSRLLAGERIETRKMALLR